MPNNPQLKNEETITEITPEEATKVLNTKAQKDIQECSAEIAKILERYGCDLDVQVILRANTVIPQVQVIKKIK